VVANENSRVSGRAFRSSSPAYAPRHGYGRVPNRRGVGWHEHETGLFSGVVRLFRPATRDLGERVAPELDGVVAKLQSGAGVAKSAAGRCPTIVMAKASRAVTSSAWTTTRPVTAARKAAAEAGAAADGSDHRSPASSPFGPA